MGINGVTGLIFFAFLPLTFVLNSNDVQAARSSYPKGFLWGVGISAHQTEGLYEGGETGDWWHFEHQETVSPIADKSNADVASDHWNRYPEDLALAQRIGVNTVRVTLAWEKIQPKAGTFNKNAIAHYRAVLTEMRRLGLRPVVSLQHLTHPQWFHDRGGWLSPNSPRLFLEYASFVVQELSPLCDLWITFEEPMTLVIQGYLQGIIPPQLNSADSAFEAAFQIARAHRIIAAMIHDRQGYSPGGHGPDGFLRGVGLANRFDLYQASRTSNVDDKRATQRVEDFTNWSFIRGITSGELEFLLSDETNAATQFKRSLPKQDLPPWDIGPSLDWIGVNYRTRHLVRSAPGAFLDAAIIPTRSNEWLAEDGFSVYPKGLEIVLRQTAERFVYPIVVTGNGLADSQDSQRAKFILTHLTSLDDAIYGSSLGSPLDIRGYFHWSLIDGFEWLNGYKYKTGLIRIDTANQLQRTLRPSAKTYSDEISRRRRRQK